ncbi:NTPase [Kitasatospora aureofaciens]|uniref:Response regulator n=1 Tax=Streptomyces rimosus subsp. rimosus (strain ATCC 10970 / DSM 40260 / JCM 4667 / NRRL 2234) TaxID=1265868 RepID=A0A8A1UYI1_STRR1|nr:NTPase [Kitasatospora aureofaciens]MYT41484.1 response regulator [Streptomyces sp. SID5471]QDA09550.1 NTPase [Streptomyces rimosus]QGY71819.1 response regulator [Streptomyces rimosus R6-500]QST86166.1 response regulator [Streptomyces rimosus subsp. rimosus ATCC 10970]QTL91605.1 response regulator [Streptomyces rimosus subsp. rimosus]
MVSSTQRLSLLNDEPVDSAGGDLLGAGRAARQLADLLLASRASTPFTLAVDAGWGMGKSSLMRLVDAELTTAPEVHTVWYNAWTSTGADALEGLIKSVLMRFDRRLLRRALHRVSEQRALLRVLRALATVAAGPLGAAGLVDELWSSLSVNSQARNEMRDAIRDLAQEWSQNAAYSPRRMLVVFIDDLDRCSEETVLAVCEAVKVYLDVPGLAFVIGCDRSVMGPSGLLRDLSPAGTAFMEKIFQTSYRIPVADGQDVREYIARCARTAGIEQLLDEPLVDLLAERSARNPRRIKRLVNGFVLEATLNPMWADHPPEAVLRTLLIQYFYADFYRMMTSPPGADEGDVVADFCTYRRVRTLLRTSAPVPDEERPMVEAFLAQRDVPQSLTDPYAVLERLERELPTVFPDMVTDAAFNSLLDGLLGLPRSEKLVRRLREGAPALVAAPQREPDIGAGAIPDARTGIVVRRGAGFPDFDPQAPLAGRTILWVDDRPENNTSLAAWFRREGATVETAVDSAAADAAIAARVPSLIISDIARGTDDRAGFTHVAALRRDERYTGPVVFFAGRVTPARQDTARDLGALGVAADADELIRLIRGAFAAPYAPPVHPSAARPR